MEKRNVKVEKKYKIKSRKKAKGISTAVVIIMLIAVLIIGIVGGYLLSKNDSLFSKNETQSNNTDNTEKKQSENIARNELIEESETLRNNNCT